MIRSVRFPDSSTHEAAPNGLTHLHKLIFAVSLLIMIILGGTVGFMLLEDMTFLGALYMTVITLSTVGFREVAPLDATGQVFTIILIMFGLAGGAFTGATIGQMVVEGQLRSTFGRKKMETKIKKMTGHYIIAGYGRVGSQVAHEFKERNVPFIVIDRDPSSISRLDAMNVSFIEGEATDEEVLRHAGIDRARTLISTLPDEAQNVYLTLTARDMNKDLIIISRADYDGGEKKLLRAGANHVVSPHVMGGMRMAMASLRPNVVDFMQMTSLGEGGLSIEEVVIPSGCNLDGQTLVESKLKDTFGVTIIGIKKRGQQMSIAPGPNTVLNADDTLVLIGPNDGLERLSRNLDG